MKITFENSFFASLKKIQKQNTWWYKTLEFFRRDIPWFLKNIYRFRKELWSFRLWEATDSLGIFKRGLILNKKTIEQCGSEVDGVRLKKVAMMNRAIQIIENYIDDKYISIAEAELGLQVNSDYLFGKEEEPETIRNSNSKIFDKSYEIGEEEWVELWDIIKGRKPIITDKNEFDHYYAQDGSGIKGWWD